MPRRTCTRCVALSQPGRPTKSALLGREILFCWGEDLNWYVAVVVAYNAVQDEYRIVYRADDALETTKLVEGRWILLPKHRVTYDNKMLIGAVIEFIYPGDGKRHRAMVYEHSTDGDRIKIAYLNEEKTDLLCGSGWVYITQSPCADTNPYQP